MYVHTFSIICNQYHYCDNILPEADPAKPFWQLHVKKFISSTQTPPFSQGLGEQSSISLWQEDPVKPGGHSHTTQAAFGDPPFWHVNLHAI